MCISGSALAIRSTVMDIRTTVRIPTVTATTTRRGYYHGSIDGVIGNGTRTAIRSFERNNGLPVDGVIDRQLLATMGLS